MPRDEFIAWLNRLIVDGVIKSDEALEILAKYDRGEIDPALFVLMPAAIVPTAIDGNDEAAAAILLGATLGRRGPARLTDRQHLEAANGLHDTYTDFSYEQAETAAAAIGDWQDGAVGDLTMLSGALIALGQGVRQLTNDARLLQIMQQEAAYISRFGDEQMLHQVRGQPMSTPAVASRSALYGSEARAESFTRRERQFDRGDGWVQRYQAVDDGGTCSPCLEAQGYYLPGEGPMPGRVCLGRGRCRCSRESEYNYIVWLQLTTGGDARVPLPESFQEPPPPIRPSSPVVAPIPERRTPTPTPPTMRDVEQIRREKKLTPEKLTSSWVNGSNRPKSIVLKHAVKEEFGGRGLVMNRNGHSIDPADVAVARNSVRQMYNTTQAELRRRGVTEVTLYRGVKSRITTHGAVESWTTDKATAYKFDGHDVIEQRISTDRIFMYSGGPGWKNGRYGEQFEYMVMAEDPK